MEFLGLPNWRVRTPRKFILPLRHANNCSFHREWNNCLCWPLSEIWGPLRVWRNSWKLYLGKLQAMPYFFQPHTGRRFRHWTWRRDCCGHYGKCKYMFTSVFVKLFFSIILFMRIIRQHPIQSTTFQTQDNSFWEHRTTVLSKLDPGDSTDVMISWRSHQSKLCGRLHI